MQLPTTSIENNNPNERRRGTANLTRSSDASESGLRDDHHTHISGIFSVSININKQTIFYIFLKYR